MAGLPQCEQDGFLAAHPDLYEHSRGAVRVKIRKGRLADRLTCECGLRLRRVSRLGGAQAARLFATTADGKRMTVELIARGPPAPPPPGSRPAQGHACAYSCSLALRVGNSFCDG